MNNTPKSWSTLVAPLVASDLFHFQSESYSPPHIYGAKLMAKKPTGKKSHKQTNKK